MRNENIHKVVLDCNILVDLYLSTKVKNQPFETTTGGQMLNAALRHRRTESGERIVFVTNWHICATTGEVLAKKLKVTTLDEYWAWINNLQTHLLAQEAVIYDTSPQDVKQMLARSRQDDGCRDFEGNPDTEDEFVLDLVARTRSFLYTNENPDNLPAAARRRGLKVGDLRAMLSGSRTRQQLAA